MEKIKYNLSVTFIKKKALPILKKHAVKRASIFGSFARGTAKSSSDVDFVIEYKKEVITYDSIYWRIRERVLSEQVVIL